MIPAQFKMNNIDCLDSLQDNRVHHAVNELEINSFISVNSYNLDRPAHLFLAKFNGWPCGSVHIYF